MPLNLPLATLLAAANLGVSSDPAEIPFQRDRHLVLVEGSIGEIDGLRMVIDTGTTFTLVGRSLGSRLGLDGSTPARVVSPAATVAVRRTRLEELRLGSRTYRDVEARIVPLEELARGRFEVVVGLNVLRQSNLTVDYGRNRLQFGDDLSAVARTAFAGSLPFILVPVRLAAQRGWMMLDTAASSLLFYRPREGRETLRETHSIRHLGGQTRLTPVNLSDLVFGGRQWGPARAFRVLKSEPPVPGLAGILPPAALGVARLHLDFANFRVGFEPAVPALGTEVAVTTAQAEGTLSSTRSSKRTSPMRRWVP